MSKKEKIVIYPFEKEFSFVLNNKDFLERYEIAGLVSPNGWMNKSYNNIMDKNIKISDNFDELIDSCDTVIFNKSFIELDFSTDIKPKIIEAVKKDKNIICNVDIDNETNMFCSEYCEKRDKYFKLNGFNSLDKEKDEGCIYKLETPVIFVMSMGEKNNKFEIQLGLKNFFEEKGYKVTSIGTKNYCEMLGSHSIPKFMYRDEVGDYKKIVMFNNYVKDLEIKEKPDLMIIGIPGGLFAFNDKFLNKFGMVAYQISRAVTPDASVLSLFYEKYNLDFFNQLEKIVKYRFSTDITCYNLTNLKVDWSTSLENNKLSYVTIKPEEVDQEKREMIEKNIKMFNSLNIDDLNNMGEFLLDTLNGYADIESI